MYYISTDFGVDSPSRFLLEHGQTNSELETTIREAVTKGRDFSDAGSTEKAYVQ